MIPAATSYTRTLAEFAAGLQAEQVPSEPRHEAGRIILDSVGCAVAAPVALGGARSGRGPRVR